MKTKINKLNIVLLTLIDLEEILQNLSNKLDLKDWRYLTCYITYELKDAIKAKRIAIIY
jgi:hypothetical protein